ncbi:MAG: hypothetical protein QXX94_01510 [Candidatus Bathyarchaeia archaeon]
MEFGRILNLIIGGAICLFIFLILEEAIRQFFISSNILGILIFDEARLAYNLIKIGCAYLPAGFLGGLFVGYRDKENLKIILLFPSIIGFIFWAILNYFFGYWGFIPVDYLNMVIMPLFSLTAGAYLGGYTVNWPTERKPKEERVSLIFKE